MNCKSLLRTTILGITFLFASHAIFADDFAGSPVKKNIIKLAPLGFIHGQLPFTVESRIGYERVIGDKSSLAGSYSYLGTNYPFSFIGSAAFSATLTTAVTLYGKPGKVGIVWADTDIKATGYRYQFQYKYYLSEKHLAPQGIYLSPHYSYAQVDYDVEMKNFEIAFKVKAKNQNYNLLFGYQKILGRHFVIDVFTGLGYRNNSKVIYDDQTGFLHRMDSGGNIKVSSGFNIGWAF